MLNVKVTTLLVTNLLVIILFHMSGVFGQCAICQKGFAQERPHQRGRTGDLFQRLSLQTMAETTDVLRLKNRPVCSETK